MVVKDTGKGRVHEAKTGILVTQQQGQTRTSTAVSPTVSSCSHGSETLQENSSRSGCPMGEHGALGKAAAHTAFPGENTSAGEGRSTAQPRAQPPEPGCCSDAHAQAWLRASQLPCRRQTRRPGIRRRAGRSPVHRDTERTLTVVQTTLEGGRRGKPARVHFLQVAGPAGGYYHVTQVTGLVRVIESVGSVNSRT